MRRIPHLIASLIIVVTSMFGFFAPQVTAATTPAASITNNGQALEIAPPLIYLTVNPGQTVKTQILIRDVSSGDLLVKGQVNDFLAAGDNGAPKVILDNTPSPYSIKSWITGLPDMTLIPKQIKTLPVTINVPANASPGGHYGVIRFTAVPPDQAATNSVSLSASLGSLVLITVSGKITHSLAVSEFTVNHDGKTGSLFQSAPLGFVEKIKNTGNVHEQPTGQIAITDMFGKAVASLNVNIPPANVLPQSTRKFTEPLDSTVIGNKHLFGHYTAKLTLAYGSNPKKTLTTSISFWVIPYKLIGIIILGLIAAFFVLRYALKAYNRRVLREAQRRRLADKPSSRGSGGKPPKPPVRRG